MTNNIMSSNVNNFFESLINSSDSTYIGQTRDAVASTPGNSEAYHQSQSPMSSGYNTTFLADRQAGSGSMFKY